MRVETPLTATQQSQAASVFYLARKIAHRWAYYYPHIDVDEFESDAMLVACLASQSPEYPGLKFSTLAYRKITFAMMDVIIRHSHPWGTRRGLDRYPKTYSLARKVRAAHDDGHGIRSVTLGETLASPHEPPHAGLEYQDWVLAMTAPLLGTKRRLLRLLFSEAATAEMKDAAAQVGVKTLTGRQMRREAFEFLASRARGEQ